MNPVVPLIKPNTSQNKSDSKKKKNDFQSSTLKGYLYDKSRDNGAFEPNSSLIIMKNNSFPSSTVTDEKHKSFDIKKALMPLVGGTVGLFGLVLGLSSLAKSSAKAARETSIINHLPDLAFNMNIKQEPEFATYMMIRDPSRKRVLAAAGVFAMSAITLISKNFVDGFNEIWVKKQEADIQRDLQERLITTETNVFSGKLQIERNLLSDTAEYFKNVLNKDAPDSSVYHFSTTFKRFANFCGDPNKQDKKNNKSKQNLLYGGAFVLAAVTGVLAGKYTFKNIRASENLAKKYVDDFEGGVVSRIENIVAAKNADKIVELEDLYKSINVTTETIRENLKAMSIDQKQIDKIVTRVEAERKSIFADAPTALGGIPKKIQYYCYLDDNRGHLYNWIMHPENKFTKYIFFAFTGLSAIGYMAKQAVDAVKKVAVAKENSNTEYGLQSRLVEVELKNYESKKTCAINPLIGEFDKRLDEGAPKEELKNLADNILLEIKNGPPFVYA